MDLSEYSVVPRKILIHNPKVSDIIEKMNPDSAKDSNFIDLPNAKLLYKQYDSLIKYIHFKGISTVTLDSLIKEKLTNSPNPNLMFTRDSSITLPWSKNVYIPCRLKLSGRKSEGEFASEALNNLGMKKIIEFDFDEYIEGGDVLPIYFENKRILIVGFGSRTTKSSIIKIANQLIPEYIDAVVGLEHNKNILHLDTGFTVLPNRVILTAKDTIKEGFTVGHSKKIVSIIPRDFANHHGYKIIEVPEKDAIENERCNILPLGNNSYVSFEMPIELKNLLEQTSNIKIHQLKGDEIDKATGGVHCLTRPIY